MLVGKRHILTCAHVINFARGKRHDESERPAADEGFDINFVAPANAELEKGYVIEWGMEDGRDLALLALKRSAPDGAKVAQFSDTTEEGLVCVALGFPQGNRAGVRSRVEIRGPVGDDLVQLRKEENSEPIEEGFSGGGVYATKRRSFIGLITHVFRKAESYFYPATVLKEFWPSLVIKIPAQRRPQADRKVKTRSEKLSHVRSNLLVVTSNADEEAERKLLNVVKTSLDLLSPSERETLGQPDYLKSSDIVVNRATLENAVRRVCAMRFAVFDVTNYEPIIMLLIGIRAVARRGVTILSLGGELALGDHEGIPFAIKDANVVYHSIKQEKRGPPPQNLLRDRFRRGIKQRGSSRYMDLPAFEAVRGLPAEPPERYSKMEGTLVLCSFAGEYTTRDWEPVLRQGLQHQLNKLRSLEIEKYEDTRPRLGVARSYEIQSPRLISHAIYDHLRWHQACIVDWTGWSPNVFYELGIRSAASQLPTQCVIEKGFLECIREFIEDPGHWEELCKRDEFLVPKLNQDNVEAIRNRLGTISDQCIKLINLFDVIPYSANTDWAEDPAYEEMLDSDRTTDQSKPVNPASGLIFGWVATEVEVSSQPAAQPAYLELLESAQRFGRDPGRGLNAVLFPSNVELSKAEGNAEFERLLAAYYLLANRFGTESILKDEALRKSCREILKRIFSGHARRIAEEQSLFASMSKLRREIEIYEGGDDDDQ